MKQVTNALLDFTVVRGYYPEQFAHLGSLMKSEPIYGPIFPPGLIKVMDADPDGETAREYRRMIRGIMLPSLLTIRKLILERGSDLAEEPPEEEWEKKYTAAQLASPGTKATTYLSVLDNVAMHCREFEMIA
eukprot:COSAG02_NODE_25939_length_645_cov_0.756410_1_plen_131_part_10